MKPVTREEFDEAMRNKKTIDEMAKLLRCKPAEVTEKIIELKQYIKDAKTALRALKSPTVS